MITAAAGLANTNLPQFTTVGVTATPAVGSVTTVRDGSGNELQSLTFGGTSGGTATLSFNGVAGTAATVLTFTTGSSPTAAQVLASLNSIPALNGNVLVLGATTGPFTIIFTGALANTNVPQLTTTVTRNSTRPTNEPTK